MKEDQYKILIVILCSLILFSCSNQSKGKSMNQPDRPINELEELALVKGDTSAYDILNIAYLDYGHGEFLLIAMEMAKKYDYPQAFFDVYFQLLKTTADPKTTLSLDSCNQKTRELAIDYLRIAYNKGHNQAIDELGNLYNDGKFLPKDTILGKALIMKYDSIMGFYQQESKVNK